MKTARLPWILSIITIIITIIAFGLLFYVSANSDTIINTPDRDKFNLATLIIFPVCWFFYFITGWIIIYYKKQRSILRNIGMFGPLGLIVAALLPNLQKLEKMVKVEVETQGIGKYLPKNLRKTKFQYVDKEEYERQEKEKEEHNQDSGKLQLKTVDGRIINFVPENLSKKNKENNLNTESTQIADNENIKPNEKPTSKTSETIDNKGINKKDIDFEIEK